MLPIAHVGHYLWILYLLPVLFVAAAILRGQLITREGASPAGGDDSEDSPERESPESETGPAGHQP
jgi:hypothetical protein